MERFDNCLQFILEREGGFVDDPADRGGATNFGITQKTYDTFRRMVNLPVQSVRYINATEISTIYKNEYWNPSLANRCAAPLDLFLFDSAVQHGTRRAVKFLQTALSLTTDGIAGAATMAAIALATKDTIDRAFAARQEFYAAIIANDPIQQKFEKGWANRMDALKKAMI